VYLDKLADEKSQSQISQIEILAKKQHNVTATIDTDIPQ